jgi:hypothetical protein
MESFLQDRPSLASASRHPQPPALERGFQPFTPPASPSGKEASPKSTNPEDMIVGQDEGEPQIELVNRDGRVERIVITCSCCKRIELQCDY